MDEPVSPTDCSVCGKPLPPLMRAPATDCVFIHGSCGGRSDVTVLEVTPQDFGLAPGLAPEQPYDDEGYLIWQGEVDKGDWLVQVVRSYPLEDGSVNQSIGVLSIYEHLGNTNYRRVWSSYVYLRHQAMFGPDVEDVTEWQDISIDIIDQRIAARDQ